jgi:O-antigen/teichoic acid export membrane protein
MTPSNRLHGIYLNLLRKETPRQAGLLFSAQMGATFLALLAAATLWRWMDPAEFGRFAFCQTVIVISSLFFEFGVSAAGARVLALVADREGERRALGALLMMATISGAAFSVFVAAVATPIDLVFKTDVRWLLMAAASLAFVQPIQMFIEQSCQGLNQIRRLSLFQLTTSGLYLMILIGLAAAHSLTAGSALLAYLAGMGLASVWSIIRLRPRFDDTSQYIKLMLKETRSYGLNIYVARITGTASVRVDNLIIAYFLGRVSTNLEPLGLFANAQRLSAPIATLSRSIAVTRFRAFAKLASVPLRIKRWNTVVLIASSLALVTIGPIALRLFFPRYSEAAPLLTPFAVLNLFVGLFQPYNMFLASHGRGKELRNIAILVTIANITGLFLIVPRFGIAGAAWTGAAAMALDYLLHLNYYRSFKRTLEETKPGTASR